MSAEPQGLPTLQAQGERVLVRTIRSADADRSREAILASADRLSRWNPVDPDGFGRLLAAQSDTHRTFLVMALDEAGSHGVVGRVNLTNIVRGRALSGVLGYDAYDPYAGRGLFAEGLWLLAGMAFAPPPNGLGLHRLEANVRPGNDSSAGLLRRIGFRHEGFSPSYLYLPDETGDSRWRDHERYAVTAHEWPAPPYAAVSRPRPVALVNGLPGSGKTTLARKLARELGVPLLSKDTVKEAVADVLGVEGLAWSGTRGSVLGAAAAETMWAQLVESPGGAVLESVFWPDDVTFVRRGLAGAGLDAAKVPEVWCELPLRMARERYERRAASGSRHAVHGPQVGLRDFWAQAAGLRPLGLGPVLRVSTDRQVVQRDVVSLGLAVRSAAARG